MVLEEGDPSQTWSAHFLGVGAHHDALPKSEGKGAHPHQLASEHWHQLSPETAALTALPGARGGQARRGTELLEHGVLVQPGSGTGLVPGKATRQALKMG